MCKGTRFGYNTSRTKILRNIMVDNEHELENKEHNVLMFRLLSTGASIVSNNVAFTTNTSSLSSRQIC